MTIEPHYSLAEAVERFFPGGLIKVSSLRTEIRKGRLRAVQVAGKYLVSESAIRELLEKCRVPEKPQGCISASVPAAMPPGSSETDRLKSARAALNQIFQGQSRH